MPKTIVFFEFQSSPLGLLRIGAAERGLREVAFVQSKRSKQTGSKKVPLSVRRVIANAKRKLDEYFSGSPVKANGLPIDWTDFTAFERKVLESLMSVPFGEVVTYGALAKRAGYPSSAARAVGNVMKKNSYPILIPCHRVVCSGGRLGAYQGGAGRKRALLAHEGVQGL